mmetsp:Transcript_26313/g.75459  ORF Transcript_26313/g.75459 Transcript_26313/m.75459 type:complete len:272 (+) Transcript_26313:642-1457(+)
MLVDVRRQRERLQAIDALQRLVINHGCSTLVQRLVRCLDVGACDGVVLTSGQLALQLFIERLLVKGRPAVMCEESLAPAVLLGRLQCLQLDNRRPQPLAPTSSTVGKAGGLPEHAHLALQHQLLQELRIHTGHRPQQPLAVILSAVSDLREQAAGVSSAEQMDDGPRVAVSECQAPCARLAAVEDGIVTRDTHECLLKRDLQVLTRADEPLLQLLQCILAIAADGLRALPEEVEDMVAQMHERDEIRLQGLPSTVGVCSDRPLPAQRGHHG